MSQKKSNNTDPKTEEPRSWEKPVAWLLGRQLIGSLKGTLLYTAFGNKIDPRDWMEACCIEPEQKGDVFWFDYIADSGDGMRATYSIAYLSMSDLELKEERAQNQKAERKEGDTETENGVLHELPRGEFLLVGGDTSYHLADYSTLANRFQTPFKWAFEDLCKIGKEPDRRPIYGIPGNHDYYDLLDGFRRQFRHPVKDDEITDDDPPNNAQLVLPGFKRGQQASYLAIKLPWNWWLWGLDTELGAIDDRQQKFFREKGTDKSKFSREKDTGGPPPDKLIVATCAPTTVFGKYARWEDKKAAQTFFQLKLPWLFWNGNRAKAAMMKKIRETFLDEMTPEKAETKFDEVKEFLEDSNSDPANMKDGQCRLDISGDVHLYARYWGPASPDNEYHPKTTDGFRNSSNHYASVVSGIGGAFHHPSYTNVHELAEQVLYPKKKTSLEVVAERIFNPFNIWRGGGVHVIGFLIAFVLYFGATVPESTRRAFEGINILFDKVVAAVILKGVASETLQKVENDAIPVNKPLYFWEFTGSDRIEFWIGAGLLSISLALVIAAAFFGRKMFRTKEPAVDWKDKEKAKKAKERINFKRQLKLWGFVLVNAVLVAFGFDQLRQMQGHLSPFGSSLMILYTLYLGAAATFFCIQYSEWLFEKAHTDYVTKSDWYLVLVVSVLGVIGVSSGLWYFGKNNQPVFVLTDILFVLVIALSIGGIVVAAILKGGEMLERPGQKFLAFLVGVWHAVLQLVVPFLFVKKSSLFSLLLAIGVSLLAYKLGVWAMKQESKLGLCLTWVLYGTVMLVLPLLPYGSFDVMLLPSPLLGWDRLWAAIIAGALGAVLSCIWLGWYLAVCFLNFQGHNNEVGGAARIENFKQFIRFRLTENTLTGYVIAVDDVSIIGETDHQNDRTMDGRDLSPKLIDVFQLSVKGSPEAENLLSKKFN